MSNKLFDLSFPKLTLRKVRKLEPSEKHLIVIPVEYPKEQETSGGIIIASKDLEDEYETFPIRFGVVESVGALVGVYKKGDTVFFGKHAGQDGDLMASSFMHIHEDQIMGIADIDYEMNEKED